MIRALGLVRPGDSAGRTGPAGPRVQIRVDASGGRRLLTIQAGLDAASTGDTCAWRPGPTRRAGNRALDFGGTRLTLWAPAGAESTIIDWASRPGLQLPLGRGHHRRRAGIHRHAGTATQGGGSTARERRRSCGLLVRLANSATSARGASAHRRRQVPRVRLSREQRDLRKRHHDPLVDGRSAQLHVLQERRRRRAGNDSTASARRRRRSTGA